MEEINNNGNKPKEEKPNPVMTLAINYNTETGELSVQAPGNGYLYDEPRCLWLLKKAERHIEMANIRASQSKIVKPQSRIKDIFRRH